MVWLVVLLFHALLIALVIAAIVYGGRTERRVAGLYAVSALISTVARHIDGMAFKNFDRLVSLTDFVLLACLVALALKVRRWWLFGAAALQTLTCLGHVAKLIDSGIPPIGYFMMSVSSSYPSLILLAIGIWQHRRDHQAPRRWSNGSSRAPGRQPRA